MNKENTRHHLSPFCTRDRNDDNYIFEHSSENKLTIIY